MTPRRRSLCFSIICDALVMPHARRRLIGISAITSSRPATKAMRTWCHKMTSASIICSGSVTIEWDPQKKSETFRASTEMSDWQWPATTRYASY